MIMDIIPEAIPLTANEQRVKALLDQGTGMFRIAFKLHMSFEAVRDMIFEIRKKEAIESMAMQSKLTQQQRAEAYRLWKEEGKTQQEIGVILGVSKATISNIIKKMNSAQSMCDALTEAEDAQDVQDTTQPQSVPLCIRNALDDQIKAINLDIETREERLADLKAEIEQLLDAKRQIYAWMEAQTWQASEH